MEKPKRMLTSIRDNDVLIITVPENCQPGTKVRISNAKDRGGKFRRLAVEAPLSIKIEKELDKQ